MQGTGKYRKWSVRLDEAGVRLWGEEPPRADVGALAGVLATERSEAWIGVTIQEGELITGPYLWLSTVPGLCWLKASKEAVDQGLVAGGWVLSIPALASGGSLAYRAAMRPVDAGRTAFEFGAYGHGPRGAELAERLAGQIRAWDRNHRHGPGPILTIHPAGTPAGDLPPGAVFRKPHTTMVLSWPEASR
jgi:protein-L-isoaspartate(D-aspartate) O-methyltransferase